VSIDNIARIARGLEVEAWRLLRDELRRGVRRATVEGDGSRRSLP
jgi:hypothetical protein